MEYIGDDDGVKNPGKMTIGTTVGWPNLGDCVPCAI